MKIILTGSLGHITKPLAETLIQKGHAVTIVSTNPGKQKDIEVLGATAAIGSVEAIDFLVNIFKNADAAYCMTPPDFSEPDQIAYYERIANIYKKAIQQSAIKRVVYLSSYGAHLTGGTGFITGSHRAEKLLDAITGIALTHIRPTSFYYNLLSFAGMIKAAGFMGSVYGGEDKLPMVSPKDIAGVIAAEIIQLNNPAKIVYVTSDDRTCNDVAGVLGAAIGKPDLTWQVLTPEQVLQSLNGNGVLKNAAENLVELGMAIHTGRLREEFDKITPKYGKVKLEDFAKEFAAVYNKQ